MKKTYHIAIEGTIGVGKTSLAHILSKELEAKLILEQFEENPFLPLFYQDQERYAFQTELFFLLSRFRQQEAFQQADLFHQHTVSDYIFSKCRLFASLTLTHHELNLFDLTYNIVNRYVPQPDMVVYLHAPVDVLLKRISKRGRAYEQNMESDYLRDLCELYQQDMQQREEQQAISINTQNIDFRNEENVDRLILAIQEGMYGRLDPALFVRSSTRSMPLQNHGNPLSPTDFVGRE